MKKFITRAAVVILIGGMSVAIGGCYGPFRLTSKLHHWNGQVSQKKFVNELVSFPLTKSVFWETV